MLAYAVGYQKLRLLRLSPNTEKRPGADRLKAAS
jgi:hypothetical protein